MTIPVFNIQLIKIALNLISFIMVLNVNIK